ncbi:MAG TPA: transketolase C-terminal domain-containing protein, partial [Acidimicrobiia bacterium]|nr:transketolase C-terminal domain-containing protein [Acidimicrobiia bacterium]
KRFDALGWHSLTIDGHDRPAIAEAIEEALAVEDKPSLVVCRTHIAHGAPTKQDTAESHGSPLGEEEIEKTKEAMGYPTEPAFHIDESVYSFFNSAMERGRDARKAWAERFDAADISEWEAYHSPAPIRLDGPGFEEAEEMATRSSAGRLFTEIAGKLPGFIGGAADLAGSTKTVIDSGRLFSKEDPAARDIPFGVREHGMGTAINGMAIHGGLKPYGATFFVFSDYMRPAVRLSALMEAPSIWVWTHDSIFLGEDGPTHQPIEHLASMRAMPHLWTIRPADANEVVQAWEVALNRTDGPVALILTRQDVPTLPKGDLHRGGYVVRDGSQVTLIATGSEVSASLGAADLLEEDNISARVVSLPCWELFEQQPADYREQVLVTAPRVSVEAASVFGWDRIVGPDGMSIGIDHFGASAPAEVLAEQFGFTPQAISGKVKSFLDR